MQKKSPLPYFTAVLFDRDGTLIEDNHYLADPEGVVLLTGAKDLVSRLYEEKRLQFVVSNQSGIGRGMFSHDAAEACNKRMVDLLELGTTPFAALLYCPHAPTDECSCRKPAIGMWQTIQKDFPVMAAHTLMVGDKADDLLFAHNAGLGACALVLTGKGKKTADALNIALTENEDFRLVLHEERPGYPQILAKDCLALLKALPLYEEKMRQRSSHDLS